MAFDITGQLNLRLASGAVRNIANEINSGLRGVGVGSINVPVKADLAAIKSLQHHVDVTTSAVDKFAQQSGLAFKRFAAFSVAALPFIGIAKSIQDVATQAVEFDRQMVRLRQVTIEAGGEVGQVRAKVNELSTSLGVSSQELIKTAVVLKQANLSLSETRDSLEALAKSALAPNFDSMAQTVEGAIAIMSQFKVSGKELEAALGSMNAVAGEFAVEAGDLIEVVRRTGGAFKATGGELNELLALFTSVRQTTRESAESIATGLRTIFTRIQRNDTVNALKEFGVQLRYTREEAARAGNMGLENQFVGAYEAIRRLSAALTQLPQQDPRYSAIIEDLGGYRQISKVIPLIQELAVSERALMVAEAGRVSLQVNAAQAADSYSNRISKLTESYAQLGRSIIEGSNFKEAFKGFETLANGLLMVMNAAKPLIPLLTTIATMKIVTTGANAFGNFQKGASYSGNGHMLGRASGGIVPGTGNTDTVPAHLDPGSFVIRKSVANVLLTPGEIVVPPSKAKAFGVGNLERLNRTGKLPGMANGGIFDRISRAMTLGKRMLGFDPNYSEAEMAEFYAQSLKRLGMENLESLLPQSARKFAVDPNMAHDVAGLYETIEKTISVHKRAGKDKITKMIGPHELIHALDFAAGHKRGSLESLSLYKNSSTGSALAQLMPFVKKAAEAGKITAPSEYKNPLEYFDEQEVLAQIYESPHGDFGKKLQGVAGSADQKKKVSELVASIKKSFPEELKSLMDTPAAQEKANAEIARRNRSTYKTNKPVGQMTDKGLEKILAAIAARRADLAKEASDRGLGSELFSADPKIARTMASLDEIEAAAKQEMSGRGKSKIPFPDTTPKSDVSTKAKATDSPELAAKKTALANIRSAIRAEKKRRGDPNYSDPVLEKAIARREAEIKALQAAARKGASGVAPGSALAGAIAAPLDERKQEIAEQGPEPGDPLPDQIRQRASQIRHERLGTGSENEALAGASPGALLDLTIPSSPKLSREERADRSAARRNEYRKLKESEEAKRQAEEELQEKKGGNASDRGLVKAAREAIKQKKGVNLIRERAVERKAELISQMMRSGTKVHDVDLEAYYKGIREPNSAQQPEAAVPAVVEAVAAAAKPKKEKKKKDPGQQPATTSSTDKMNQIVESLVSKAIDSVVSIDDVLPPGGPTVTQKATAPSKKKAKKSDPAVKPAAEQAAAPAPTPTITKTPSEDTTKGAVGLGGPVSSLIKSFMLLDKEVLQKVKDFEALDVAIRKVTQTYEKGGGGFVVGNGNANNKADVAPVDVSRPVNRRRAYEPLNPRVEFDNIIQDALQSRGRVSPYAATIGTYKGDSAARLLGDMSNVAGGFGLVADSIEETLRVTRPYLSAQERRIQAEQTATQITNRAAEANMAERRGAEARNIQKQASERSGNIDKMFALQKDARELNRRWRETRSNPDPAQRDTTARDELKRVRSELFILQGQIAVDEGFDPLAFRGRQGRTRTSAPDKALLKRRQREYEKQYDAEGDIAKAKDAEAANIRAEFAGIEVSSKQDSRGRTSLNFSGPASVVGAGVETGRRARNSLARILEDRIARRVSQVDPRGAGLDAATLQRLKDEQKTQLQQQYVNSTYLQIQQGMGITDADAAKAMALDRFNTGLENGRRARVRRNRDGTVQVLGDNDLYRSGSRGGFGQQARNTMRSIGTSLSNGFSANTGFFGLQAIGSYAGSLSEQSAGDAETRVKAGNTDSYYTAKGAGGLFSVGAMGAAAGFSIGGPYGAAAGAAIGAIYGLADGLRRASAEIGEAKIGIALKATSDALSNFAKGTLRLDPLEMSMLRNSRFGTEEEISKKSMRSASYLGFGLMYNQDTYLAEIQKNTREANVSQAAPMMDALTKIIEDQAIANVGNKALENRNAKNRSFDEVLGANGGFGQSLMMRVASATQQDPNLLREKLFKAFERTQESEATKRRQLEAETQVNRSAATFSSLASAVESASVRLARMSASMKNVSDVMDSTVSAFSGSGLAESLQRPFSGSSEFMSSVKSITGITGANKDVEAEANAITLTGRLLPSIINAVRSQPAANIARGADMSIQIADRLRESLAAQGVDKARAGIMANAIQSQLGAEDFSKLLRETGQDMGKLIQKLVGPMADPLKEAFGQIAQRLDERSKDFSERLAELANRTRATGELIDKANQARMAADRNAVETAVRRREIGERGADAMNMAATLRFQQERQTRLTGAAGGAAQDPDFIANRMKAVFAQISQAEKRVEDASKGGDIKEQNAAATQLTNLKSRAADLNQALKNLTDVSERTAAAQERLGKIQADREGRQALGMRYATANAEGRAEIARSFQLLNAAARMGTAAPFGIREQNQIFSLLSSLSPQMRLQGLGGVSVKELTNQLMSSTFGGAFDLDPQTAAMERALENFVQTNYETAARAAQLQVDNQKNLQAEFFTRLSASQDAFIAQLNKSMAEATKMMAESTRLQAASRVNDLEKQVGTASMLGKIGVKTEPQFEAVKNALKNGDQIQQIFASGREMAQVSARGREAAGKSEQFAGVLAGLNPDVSTRRLANSQAAATIMGQFAELGFTKEQDQKELLVNFSSLMDKKRAGTLGDSKDNVAAAITEAIRSFTSDRVTKAASDINKARGELESNRTIDPAIIANIVNAAQANGGDINLTTLKEAVSAVDSTNRKFTELNQALDEAKNRLNDLGKPAGLANGGPVKFFNKGGWGSGGSSNPHPSDTVNARIAPDEFVVASGPAQKNRSLLEHMNRGGLVHFDDGGPVTAQGNMVVARGLVGQYPADTVRPHNTKTILDQAKSSLQANAEIAFLQRLKTMKPEERQKFIAEQLAKAADVKDKSAEQLGYVDALTKLQQKKVAGKQDIENKKSAALKITPDDIKFYHAHSIGKGIAEALKDPGFEVESIITDVKKIQDELIKKGEDAAEENKWRDIDLKEFPRLSKISQLMLGPSRLAHHGYLLEPKEIAAGVRANYRFSGLFKSLGKFMRSDDNYSGGEYTSDPIPEIGRMGERGRAQVGDTKRETPEYDNRLRPIFDEGANRQLIKTYYGGDVRNTIFAWRDSLLSDPRVAKTSAKELYDDVFGAYQNQLASLPEFQYNIDAEIDKLITEIAADARIKTLQPQTEAVDKAIKEIADQRAIRSEAFQTTQQRLQKLVGGIDAKNFGVDDIKDIQMAKLDEREAIAFEKLNPAKKASILEKTKRRILNKELNVDENRELRNFGVWKALDNTSDISADEIRALVANRANMTVLQRAAADIMLANLSDFADLRIKAEKTGSSSMTEAEKVLYLTSLDVKGRDRAFDKMNDPERQPGLMRMASFLSTNQGLIEGRLSAAEKDGPEWYAEEAALLELLTGRLLPKAVERFSGKPFGNNKAAAQVAAPEPLPGFATGGIVPGVGNTDSVYAHLAQGSYVIRKSSVNSIGAENLHAMSNFASGGVVPAMVMPGEYIFGPKQAAAIGSSRLDTMNKTGRLPGYGGGGGAGAIPGGGRVFVGAPGRQGGWAGMPQAAPGFMWVHMPAQQAMALGRTAMPQVANPVVDEGLVGQQRDARNEAEFDQTQRTKNIMQQFNNNFTDLRDEFFYFRNKLARTRPQQRDKKDIARYRELLSYVNDPELIQMDRERQQMALQEQIAKFNESPQTFLGQIPELKKIIADTKNRTSSERREAHENLNRVFMASRMVDQKELRKNVTAYKQIDLAVQKSEAEKRRAEAAQNAPPARAQVEVDATNPANQYHLNRPQPEPVDPYAPGNPANAYHDRIGKDPRLVVAEREVRTMGNLQAMQHLEAVTRQINEENRQKNENNLRYDKNSKYKIIPTAAEVRSAQMDADLKTIQEDHTAREKDIYQRLEEVTRASNEHKERVRRESAANMASMTLGMPSRDPKERARQATYGSFGQDKEKGKEAGYPRSDFPWLYANGGIVPGTGSRDTVPALLTPGEMVVPKHQVQKFASGGMVGGSGSFSDIMDAANRFNQAAAQIGQGLSGFSTSVNAFGESVGTFGEFVAKFDEAVGKIPEEITLSGVDGVSVNITGQDSIIKAVTEALGPMIAEAIRNNQPVEQRSS